MDSLTYLLNALHIDRFFKFHQFYIHLVYISLTDFNVLMYTQTYNIQNGTKSKRIIFDREEGNGKIALAKSVYFH